MLLLLTVILTSTLGSKPTLQPDTNGQYIATNPILKTVRMTISCGDFFEKVTLDILPRTRETVEMKTAEGQPALLCFLDSWKIVK